MLPSTVISCARRLAAVPLLLVLGAAVAGGACRRDSQGTPAASPSVSPDTWAVVDGRPITRDQVEKAYRRTRDTSDPLSNEEVLAAKLGLLNDLIVQEILLGKAAALKLEVPQAELDTAYENARKNLTDEAYQQELKRRNLTVDDMREGLRREMLVQKVIDQEIGAKVSVSDKEVSDFFAANRAQFNVAEESYHIAQIVVTPAREPQVANATGDDAASPEAAGAKVKMLMERLKAGASFRDLATGYSEDPETAPRGGDLGLIPVSRLKGAPPSLRNAVLGKAPGSVNVASAAGGYTLVLVVAHEPAGQRDLSTPGVRERIAETLRGRKEQLLRLAYLTNARGEVDVQNHLAKRLVEGQANLPELLPAGPAAPAR